MLDLESRENLFSENKGTDQLRSYWMLICAFVFTYADCWVSHAAAHMANESEFTKVV